MEKREIPETTPFPQVLKVLGEGCNLAANNIRLMVIPIILDLFLLFGPKLRITDYFDPIIQAAYRQAASSISNAGIRQLELSFDLLSELLQTVNLFGFIQTFPVGVGLINTSAGDITPLGQSASIQMHSILIIIPVIMLMVILGIVAGTLYYGITAHSTAEGNSKYSIAVFGKQLLNTILMYLALFILIAILTVPISCVTAVAIMAAPILYQIFMLLMIVFACWLVVPLFYIPHGIFIKNLDFPHAVQESFRMAGWSGPLTVRFILFSVIISLGLDLIWSIPDQSSWLILISIFGHAFITTAMLAASFIMYRRLDEWQSENRAFLEWRKANLRIKQFIKKEPEEHD